MPRLTWRQAALEDQVGHDLKDCLIVAVSGVEVGNPMIYMYM